VAQIIARELQQAVEKALIITLGPDVELRVRRIEATSAYTITARDRGWQKKGARCRPRATQVASVLDQICTQSGLIELPCPKRGSTPTPVLVPRRITLQVKWGDVVELTATRQ
jgi:hypothetical protein